MTGTEADGVGVSLKWFRVANPIGTPAVPAAVEVSPAKGAVPWCSDAPMHQMLNCKLHVGERSVGGLAGLQVDCEAMKQALPETTDCVIGEGRKRRERVRSSQ